MRSTSVQPPDASFVFEASLSAVSSNEADGYVLVLTAGIGRHYEHVSPQNWLLASMHRTHWWQGLLWICALNNASHILSSSLRFIKMLASIKRRTIGKKRRPLRFLLFIVLTVRKTRNNTYQKISTMQFSCEYWRDFHYILLRYIQLWRPSIKRRKRCCS